MGKDRAEKVLIYLASYHLFKMSSRVLCGCDTYSIVHLFVAFVYETDKESILNTKKLPRRTGAAGLGTVLRQRVGPPSGL